ncbi:probable 50S ribosomal protein L23 [Thermoplasma acidophilum]|uniref:Large ribosomal subunit protein uL23 n=1 Tax=Thermoplasma acidophilum (strain ATCC 25905 / DSM 1728 / JCM 9062 / NBRC 15155 / AMRC-C165) TaxID=273075 RepID=RL23_THEAC|nr:50S ribosomal protein L23 [Thermoplasma acidophilum]Q9HIR1.1 RecName: Full=Large ribosomal subunit protein uL23; AltName: Full=50S ribosomal protein L23 [Thermoplasma acidophilum DSM 1728]CAC12393.1 probable 50S ribosomal protein L23 [Thermoplasma acidophilum]
MKGDIIISPLSTEKTALMAEKENKLTLMVRRDANREMIKKEVEERFGVKVEGINVMITKKGKKAIVKLAKEYSAEEIAERIGVF